MNAPGAFGHAFGSPNASQLKAMLSVGIDHAYRLAWTNLAHQLE
jgi:hypothetical protein